MCVCVCVYVCVCAKKIKNEKDSSRFGKYLEIVFNFNGKPIGGKIKVILFH